MPHIHCVQLLYNLSDSSMEDMLYEIDSVRRFVGLKIAGPIPDESTILKFRHLLEFHDLGTKLFEVINQHYSPGSERKSYALTPPDGCIRKKLLQKPPKSADP